MQTYHVYQRCVSLPYCAEGVQVYQRCASPPEVLLCESTTSYYCASLPHHCVQTYHCAEGMHCASLPEVCESTILCWRSALCKSTRGVWVYHKDLPLCNHWHCMDLPHALCRSNVQVYKVPSVCESVALCESTIDTIVWIYLLSQFTMMMIKSTCSIMWVYHWHHCMDTCASLKCTSLLVYLDCPVQVYRFGSLLVYLDDCVGLPLCKSCQYVYLDLSSASLPKVITKLSSASLQYGFTIP